MILESGWDPVDASVEKMVAYIDRIMRGRGLCVKAVKGSSPFLFIVLLRTHQSARRLLVMTIYQLRLEQALQPLDHLQTLDPSIVIARQPAVRVRQLIILRNVELIRGPDERPILVQIHLHHTQPRRMARRVVQSDALKQVEVLIRKGVPLEALQVHVVAQVNTEVCTGGDGPASVLELFLVDVDRHVCADEML